MNQWQVRSSASKCEGIYIYWNSVTFTCSAKFPQSKNLHNILIGGSQFNNPIQNQNKLWECPLPLRYKKVSLLFYNLAFFGYTWLIAVRCLAVFTKIRWILVYTCKIASKLLVMSKFIWPSARVMLFSRVLYNSRKVA